MQNIDHDPVFRDLGPKFVSGDRLKLSLSKKKESKNSRQWCCRNFVDDYKLSKYVNGSVLAGRLGFTTFIDST